MNVKVLEANTNKEIADADVRVRSISTGAEIVAAVTAADGTTGRLAIPGDKVAKGLQVRAKSKDHKEHWSDVAPTLLSWKEAFTFMVNLDQTIDERLYNTWRSPYFNDVSVVFRRDGTATYTSNHLNFSNTFKVLSNEDLKISEPGTWVELWNPEKTFRFLFRFRDGKVEFPGPIG